MMINKSPSSAETDKGSKRKVEDFEINLSAVEREQSDFAIHTIPRGREVGQSWSSALIFTTYASIHALKRVFLHRPDLLLCNGPGTCIPVCLAVLLFKIVLRTRIVYVESICRVKTLSMSGKILYYLTDRMLVQWKELHDRYPRTEFIGRLV